MPPGWWMIAEHPVRESVHSGRRARGPAKPQGLRERCTLSRTASEHLSKIAESDQDAASAGPKDRTSLHRRNTSPTLPADHRPRYSGAWSRENVLLRADLV